MTKLFDKAKKSSARLSTSKSTPTSSKSSKTKIMEPPSPLTDYLPNDKADVQASGLKLLKSLYNDQSIWKFEKESEDIKLYSYYQAGNPLPTTKGDGVIEGCSLEELLAVIYHSECRSVWDKRLDKSFPLGRYDRNTAKFYSAQKGAGWLVWGRDFVGVSTHLKEEDGTAYYYQKSAHYDDVPDQSGLVNVDPKGSLPSAIVASIATETPLCVARVRDYLKDRGYPAYIPQHEVFPGVLQRETVENGALLINWRPESTNSFDVYFDKRFWKNGAMVVGGDQTNVEADLKVEEGEGKLTISCTEVAKGKDLKILVEKA